MIFYTSMACMTFIDFSTSLTYSSGVNAEGGPLNRAPRASILAETYVLQCLSVVLQETSNITPEEYVKRHPGGSLGKLREGEY